MSRVGIVLGGGGVSGAAYELGCLMALRLATDWDPNEAEVIVGTSAGSTVAAITRSDGLHVDLLVRGQEDQADVTARISRLLYKKQDFTGFGRWMRRGILPGLRNPGVSLVLGAPGRFSPVGIGDWVEHLIGDKAHDWPERATVCVAFDLEARERVAFGTESAPDVTLFEAAAASSAVPIVFDPFVIDGIPYVDGGIASGTHADLVLANPEPLDLVLVIAPMASEESSLTAHPLESVLDRVGRKSLEEEIGMIQRAWPDTDIVILRPRKAVLRAMRPNPMDPARAVPTFVATLASMRTRLASADTWAVLRKHLT
ncbi:MAG: patatin-like phospholipase family protein [Acidimicrobiia bacterium]|nr:MAG: patatin-like phospholipase family protein [Acidimicrobiia bacterium]